MSHSQKSASQHGKPSASCAKGALASSPTSLWLLIARPCLLAGKLHTTQMATMSSLGSKLGSATAGWVTCSKPINLSVPPYIHSALLLREYKGPVSQSLLLSSSRKKSLEKNVYSLKVNINVSRRDWQLTLVRT